MVVEPGRLLITGASGFLGWHLCRLARDAWQVHGTFHQHPVELARVQMHRVDLTQPDELRAWLEELAPTAVIHTAALAQPNRCEQQPDLSYAINVEGTQELAQFCGDRQIPLVFTSTDQVFDGQAAPYSEADTPHPINCYGRHKLEAERRLRQAHPGATICRMPLMYGPASPRAACFLQEFLRTLATGQPLTLFTDEYRSPAYVEDAAAGLLLALDSSLLLLHLGGPERISRYEFGLRMAAVFGLDPGLIVPCQRADVPMPAARPADVSTSSQRAFALGYRPRGVMAGLRAVLQGPITPLG
ncbi:MAG TPA: NAD(P)-dependent oxidoreductase [Leptolyngbyaceae cyanobacterium M65_K2018_010]|nr:NAD(P)-dependent oxidoreductase [Leptolyngbyaceae cyanobacterium M65_K2018_010]